MKRTGFFWFCFLLAFLAVAASCNKASSGQSFTSTMDSIDVFISLGDTESALKLLKKASRQASSALQRLGVYKRYARLGSTELAEECLVKGLKKLPESAELRAVYAWFLCERGRTAEARLQAELLAGTPYASVLAEFRLEDASAAPSTDFLSRDFAAVYADAYVSSRNQAWLRNAAVVCARGGDFSAACSFAPKAAAEMPVFWAYVAYDARRYNAALDYAALVSEPDAEVLSLSADAHGVLGDHSSAEDCRRRILSLGSEKIPPEIYFNSARHAFSSGELLRGHELLDSLVRLYPLYAPGLDMYADFALRCLDLPEENRLAQALRGTDLRSAGMQEYDGLPRVSLVQAGDALSAAVSESGSPELAALLFLYESNADVSPNLLPEERVADVWLLLERHLSDGQYPRAVVELAVPVLLRSGRAEDARTLFDGYLRGRFGTDSYAELLRSLSPKECECAAYFAASGAGGPADFRLALLLYGFLAEDDSERYPGLAGNPGYNADVPVLVNLAGLYAGTRQFQKARDLYSAAAGLAESDGDRAEVMFRLASLQHETGDVRAAKVSLDYCLSLAPSHAKARILRNKLPAD